ncbi:putative dynein regulatory complex protein 1 [Monocercomonoides exilis]|uniref:putative dynein regulatory complex protein 1 n=1 Tax=Monocercomonoides exilis TaxID=2049356 RepID=UPI0035595AF4|nr:putative dynein regulatory complex protein 1 [Monocercomonoides exilis]|eukprot:MONOS_11014.1-p1 / transcript=MONOS_11014.1 / gene=MONOS_11014 / organism=Monocercomonoides_exilis_PA203 / gene_product=dynein regulatory complex protein 1 / transcript_product=dynein regulatory complex protein 1 / location=Mono_scaffold00528:22706-25485(-) / protein_length=776 / sequence_SO=supercontig / SO=protein_coding / is_pseudo=false
MSHLQQARSRLETLKTEKQERITKTLIKNDEKEAKRRKAEDDAIALRQGKREAEIEFSRLAQAKTDLAFDRIKKKTDPLAMDEEIKHTKELYEQIISSKDNLISELRGKLEDNDHEYMNSLREQRKDIDDMLQTMRETYRELATGYEDELEKLEAAYDKEREQQLETFRTEIDGLLERRRKTEVIQIEVARQTREEQAEQLEKMRQRAAEEFNAVTIMLEKEVEDLEEQHAEMRSTVQLNQQKLQYNVKVLGARAKENSVTKSTQQAKASRVAEALAAMKEKLAKTTEMYKAENERLTEEYQRVTANFKELQSKFRHFELTDERQFQELYAMHEEEILALARKAMRADKIITEQQLGMVWQPPPVARLDEEKEEEMGKGEGEYEEGGTTRRSGQVMGGMEAVDEEEEEEEDEEDESSEETGEDGKKKKKKWNNEEGNEEGREKTASEKQGDGDEQAAAEAQTGAGKAERLASLSHSPALVREVLQLITEECSFLAAGVDIEGGEGKKDGEKEKDEGSERREKINDAHQKMLKTDAILKVLGIHSVADLNRLLAFFLVDPSSIETEKGKEKEKEKEKGKEKKDGKEKENGDKDKKDGKEDEKDKTDVSLQLLPRKDVVAAVKAFTEEMQRRDGKKVAAGGDDSISDVNSSTIGGNTSVGSMSRTTGRGSKGGRSGRRGRNDISKKPLYWAAARDVISDDKMRLWKVMSAEGEKYNTTLNERASLIEKTAALKQQNDELKALLNRYLSSKDNAMLISPPTHVYQMTSEIAPDALPRAE